MGYDEVPLEVPFEDLCKTMKQEDMLESYFNVCWLQVSDCHDHY